MKSLCCLINTTHDITGYINIFFCFNLLPCLFRMKATVDFFLSFANYHNFLEKVVEWLSIVFSSFKFRVVVLLDWLPSKA